MTHLLGSAAALALVVSAGLGLALAQTTPNVRVVSPSAAKPPTDEAEGAAAEDNASRWQQERSSRFKRAPEREDPLPQLDAGPPVAVPIPPVDTNLREGAILRQLDKMTGETWPVDLSVGQVRLLNNRLRVSLSACRAAGDGDTHGTMAFLKIWDTKHPEDPPVFSGWMFADSPALSALDHPRYDVWVISCTTETGEASAAKE